MLKQKTVYFREKDLPLWEAIENKAQWLHEKLNDVVAPYGEPKDIDWSKVQEFPISTKSTK